MTGDSKETECNNQGKAIYLIVHVGTNEITNNVNLLTKVKKIFNKVSKELPSASIAFSSIIAQRQDEHPENLNRYECPFACKEELVL